MGNSEEMGDEMEDEMETWQETCSAMLAKERVGMDDMTELEHVDDHTIAENLKIRLLVEQIYVSLLELEFLKRGPFQLKKRTLTPTFHPQIKSIS